MKNIHSSDGIAEDMIRSIVQMGCAEVHAKTLYEKAVAELENGLIDVENDDVVHAQLKKIEAIEGEIGSYASIRRKIMLRLFDMFQGDKSYWCEIKHLGIAAYTLFEAWEASDNDETLLDLANEAQKAFTRALCAFLGKEITDCAACFADMIKEK